MTKNDNSCCIDIVEMMITPHCRSDLCIRSTRPSSPMFSRAFRSVRFCAPIGPPQMEILQEVTGGAKGLPRAGLVQSTVYNKMIKYYMTTACPNYFDDMEKDIPRGAIAGLETMAASSNNAEFMAVLDACSEKKFFKSWKSAIEATSETSTFKWTLNRIKYARLDTVYGVIGAQRGDHMKGKQFVELFGQHFIVSPEFAEAIRIQDFKERASKSLPFLFADGAIIRARVIIGVDQTVKLPSELSESEQKNVEHLMTLEMSLTPRIGKKSILASETILEMTEEPMTAGDWRIVDVNFSMSDNYPLEPPEVMKDEDDQKKGGDPK